MLEHHEAAPYSYNEVVLDTTQWNAHLPATIEAFVFAGGPGDKARACAAFNAFLKEFPSANGVVPMVSYDEHDSHGAFSGVDCS